LDIVFEPVNEGHVAPLTDIFNHYIEHSTALFIVDPIGQDEMRPMLFFEDARHKAFAIYVDAKLAGFLSIHAHNKRAAYRDTADISLYLAPEFIRLGIGSRAMDFIEGYAREQGFHVLLGSISGENVGSMGLCEKKGYEKVAQLKELGFKHGRYLDVVWYEKILS
jgi:phosphinothricin acetyltransferase